MLVTTKPAITPWTPAEMHLRGTSREMHDVIERVGSCTLTPRKDYFVVLCEAIFNQQISTKVANVLFERFRQVFPGKRPTPARLVEVFKESPEALKGCGVSRQKRVYLQDLAEHFVAGMIPTRRLAGMTDDEVIESLVRVKGIGRWTAEMFLMFTLNRPDVLPVDDLGLQKGVQRLFSLKKMPDKKKLTRLAEPWKPYRSIATWYVWRGMY